MPVVRRLLTVLPLLLLGCSEPAGAPKPVASRVFPDLVADEVWHIPGLKGRVEIVRDVYGIPHSYGENILDVIQVQGYTIARDRFWQMDLFRRLSSGRLTTLVGISQPVIDIDLLFRSVNLTDDGRMVADVIYEQMTDEDRELVQAFCDGVNLYLEHAAGGRYGATFPPEYNELALGLLFQPTALDVPRWKPQDSLALGRFQQWLLAVADFEQKILLGKIYAATVTNEALRNWLVRFAPVEPNITVDDWAELSNGAPARALEPLAYDGTGLLRFFAGARAAMPGLFLPERGSNNWAVGPAKTANGHVLVANDPHLMMFNPPLFYQGHANTVELGGGDWNSYGVVFPGIPVFMIAHNERVAWGVTTVEYDVTDVYREEVESDGLHVRRGSGKVRIGTSTQEFCHGYTDDCVTRELRYVPGHGPVIAGTDEFFTFKWPGAEPTHDYRAFRNLMQARNVGEALQAVRHFKVGAQNFVVGDVEGNIGFMAHANIPVRDPECPQPPFMPLDGASGKCEWIGYLPESKTPTAVNPPKGYIATANNDIVGTLLDNDPANDKAYYRYLSEAGFRIHRVQTLLESEQKLGVEDMARIQADVVAHDAARMAPHIVAAGKARPDLLTAAMQEAIGRLEAWSYRAASGVESEFHTSSPSAKDIADSIATSIYYTWMRYLDEDFLNDKFAALGIEKSQAFNLISTGDTYGVTGSYRTALYGLEGTTTAELWDDWNTPNTIETKEEVLLAALAPAVEWLAERFGTAVQDAWRWGELHYIRFFDIHGFLGANLRSIGPYPNDGGTNTVDNGAFIFMQDSYVQVGGPQMRMVTELAPGRVRSWNAFPGGQVHDRNSPFYDNLVKYWMTNTTYEVPFYKEDVREKMHRLTIVLPGE